MTTQRLILTLWTPLCLILGGLPSAFACDSSAVSLISYVDNGSSHEYEIQLCVGGGRQGLDAGANDATETIAIALYRSGATVAISDFTPAITSTEMGVTMNSAVLGPNLNPPFESENILAFLHMGGDPFTCISSTVLCGTPHADCFTIAFTSSVSLDSLRVFGVEGNGNPVAGCTYQADMKLSFLSAPLLATLSRFEGQVDQQTVSLRWQTSHERNHDYFAVEHRAAGEAFTTLGTIEGHGGLDEVASYRFEHRVSSPGSHYYRLRQVDLGGEVSYSETLAVNVAGPPFRLETLQPGRRYRLNGALSQEGFILILYDAQGRIRGRYAVAEEIDLSSVAPGMYWLRGVGTTVPMVHALLRY